MRAKQESCCFTGHRPDKLPWRYDEQDPRCAALKRRIADAVESAYAEGFRHFLCGMALGSDLYFCESVLALREKHPEITLEAAIPCPTQADAWPPDQQARYRRLLDACDAETMVSSAPTVCSGETGIWWTTRPWSLRFLTEPPAGRATRWNTP